MKLTIDAPEGEYCKGCLIDELSNLTKCGKFKENRKHRMGRNGGWTMLKCPACVAACQQYRDEHDYEKARKILDEIPLTGVKFALKALKYDKEVKNK